jgi:hypothetical protein
MTLAENALLTTRDGALVSRLYPQQGRARFRREVIAV